MRSNLAYFALIITLVTITTAQDSKFPPAEQQIPVPECLTMRGLWEGGSKTCTQNEHEAWLADIRHWRNERRVRIGYNGSRYDLPALQWTQSSFIQPQMMVHDRYFYDPVLAKYTVDRYLDDLEKRYGGIDAVLIWPTYPNMGIDNRNQHDMIRSMPGGLTGVKQMIADFHRRGVRVLFPMMMWDQGTRDPGMPWPYAIATLMAEIGADGINGDTQDGVPLAFTLAADEAGHPLAFEPEGGPSDEALAWNVMRWGQYQFPFTPLVDKYKWLEPRHMVNISDRWKRDKTDDLQFAFFNGVGWESWENIWGIWNGITPCDAEATRRVATIERAIAPFLVSKMWEPMAPMLRYGVYASRWPMGEQAVWTIVNRNEYALEGDQIEILAMPGIRYFDLYRGVELTPEARSGERTVLTFPIEAKGYGAVLATNTAPDQKIVSLMSTMKNLTTASLSTYSHEWTVLPQQIVPIQATKAATTTPAGMIKIPEADFTFRVSGIEIEGFNDVGVDVQYPWEDSPRRFHQHTIHVNSFYIDKFPVTNADFKKFIDATRYHPKDDLDFLRDWKDGVYPSGWENKPVTWVSQEDARAYAAWAGKRLPHEWEWQYAAQGPELRLYPWGNEWHPAAVPVPDRSRNMRGPDAVDAHSEGASPFGVMDLVGNVWQWTEEFVDGHTRAAIVRGGSYYQPQGSIWYFPQAYKLNEHGKLLLMSPSMDRSAALGFRCVADTR
ncbi:MAG TPA: SUMF1/EgtB/PvdO family nonheme iron enzyme [Candidatus Sulfotelmatobacter sp.]|jgi:formylglycine-generating enzyme required for sulfatase activity|nr:SUMF1/EgtB/PvdO family nonheme iron enzyme [Candidatus Sulfotelmatobacter sp.]